MIRGILLILIVCTSSAFAGNAGSAILALRSVADQPYAAKATIVELKGERVEAPPRRVPASRPIPMVEHNLSVVASLSDRITVLARGQVLAEGDYAEVSKDPRVVEAYIGSGVGHAH